MHNHLHVTQSCLQVGDTQEFPWIAGQGVTHHWCFTGIHCHGIGSLPAQVYTGAHQPKLLLQQLMPSSPDQKPPTRGEECKNRGEECKSSVVWDLREENNMQMSDENKTTSENTATFFCLRHFLGKSIQSEGPKQLLSPVQSLHSRRFLFPPVLKIKTLFLQPGQTTHHPAVQTHSQLPSAGDYRPMALPYTPSFLDSCTTASKFCCGLDFTGCWF